MSTSRILALGVAASTAFFVGCIALIAWGTERAPVLKVGPGPRAPDPVAAAPVERAEVSPELPYVPAPSPRPLPVAAPAPRPEADPAAGPSLGIVPPSSLTVAPVPPPPRRARAASAPPPESPVEGARSPHLSMELTDHRFTFRAQLISALGGLQQHVARCGPERLAHAQFTLSLESLEGGVRVLDAQVQAPGGASPKDLTCAREALRGQVVRAPNTEPGRSWTMPFVVRPTA